MGVEIGRSLLLGKSTDLESSRPESNNAMRILDLRRRKLLEEGGNDTLRNSVTPSVTIYYKGDQEEEGATVGGACVAYVGNGKQIQIWIGNPKSKRILRDLFVNGRAIFKIILNKWIGKCGQDSAGTKKGRSWDTVNTALNTFHKRREISWFTERY
jgi:hypothetical protein